MAEASLVSTEREGTEFDLKPFLNYFQAVYPNPVTELNYSNAFELLVAVILSAQCTDKRVNQVTPGLFEAFPTPATLAEAEYTQILKKIESISYPYAKAKHLLGMAKKLVEDFSGEVPERHEDLISLPGVGRKTANVVRSVLFGAPTIAVDTHVFRLSKRLGFAPDATNVLQVEKKLLDIIPEDLRADFHHYLILHGRRVCMARKPKCEKCGLTAICPTFQKQNATDRLK